MSETRRKIGAEMKVQMFKAVDSFDDELSLFIVNGNEMAVAMMVDEDKYNYPKFNPLNIDLMWEDLDQSRMINPELIWESEE